jgi:DNA-binding GntR family transcriptional regulator
MADVGDQRVFPLQVKDVVYARLREALIDQTFLPGEPLREAALTERYGVSKTPIREALARLEREGLVEVAPYRGARARSYTSADVQEIYEVREILEAECVRRAVTSGDPVVLAALERTVEDSVMALGRGDLPAAARALDAFDAVLFDQLCNDLLNDIVERVQAHVQRVGRVGAGAERFRSSIDEHRAIVEAIRAGDASIAQQHLRTHLQSVMQDQLRAIGASVN